VTAPSASESDSATGDVGWLLRAFQCTTLGRLDPAVLDARIRPKR